MPRPITSKTTLDSLRTEAKRWLKAIRANVAGARARFERAVPNPNATTNAPRCPARACTRTWSLRLEGAHGSTLAALADAAL